jgi:hypothetical protein
MEKVLRKLTGILEEPGILTQMNNVTERC